MKTQIFNKTLNIPVSIDNEQFVTVGAAIDLYTLVNSKLRSIDTVFPAVFDLLGGKYGDMPRVFLIATDESGAYSFAGGTAADFGDSTLIPYALYDATTFSFVGFYRLDDSSVATYLAGGDNIANDTEYIAMPMSDVPLALFDGAVKAQASLKSVVAKGITNVMTVTEVDDTANKNVGIKVNSNQYTTDLMKFKVAVIEAKYWKRLQFPFHTAFEGTQYNVGQSVAQQFALDGATSYILVFFKDAYGNVSFPFIFVVNP